MSDTFVEVGPRAKSLPLAEAQPRAHTRWLKRAVVLVVILWVASEGMSLALQHTRLRGTLTSSIATAFGRPVEVGSYDFSLWEGPAIEASSVTVAEDPRFGEEYFLRADSMTVRLRWSSLLRGQIRLGTLSLERPSLNLVRNAAGDWNLAEWLPQPNAKPPARVPVGPVLPFSALRFSRIEVDGGRINLKSGAEKLPFAFVGVNGTVETDAPGRWRMNLDATPWRAAVITQQAGTIHLSGDIGGTSSRLRPAALAVSWTEASLSDVLRLAGGNDFGVRGATAMAVSARTRENEDGWTIQARAQLEQVHRSDLPLRPDNPSLNLAAKATWSPTSPDIQLTDVTLEAPHSTAHATGRVRWNSASMLAPEKTPPVEFTLTSLLDVSDLLPWLRAFHPGIAENIIAGGHASLRAQIQADAPGWPVRVVDAAVSSDGVDLVSSNFRRPAHLGPLQFVYDQGRVSLAPVSLAFGSPESSVQFETSAKPGRGAITATHIAGFVSDARDVLAVAGAFGWNLAAGWDISGPVRADLRWQGDQYPWQAAPVGIVTWGAGPGVAILRVPFLNLPVDGINATTEWKPGSRHIVLASAQAFGTRWSGTFDSRDPARDWQFTLAADHLAAADLDRWLNPAWRESFLGRMLPFLNARPLANAAPANLRAAGRLTVDQFSFAPLVLHRLQGDLKIEGRAIEFTNATAEFYKGQLNGSLRANLQSPPAYHADVDYSRVDMPSFLAANPGFAGLRAESATGQISLDASGASRSDLLASLTCQGEANVAGPEFLDFDLWKPLGGQSQQGGGTRFPAASAKFTCAKGRVEFQTLHLVTGENSAAEGTGTVDFNRDLHLNFQLHSSNAGTPLHPISAFQLTGSLASPKVIPDQPVSRRSR
jgi:uncharacterized protein involved in outer membrane biogenesis